MRALRAFMYRKRVMAKGVSVVFAVAVFTLITLTSCSGITKPCLTCTDRTIASDPFESGAEVEWETEEDRKKRRMNRRRPGGRRPSPGSGY